MEISFTSLITVSIILTVWVYFGLEQHKHMGKLNGLATIIIISIAALTLIPQAMTIHDSLNDMFGDLGLFLFCIVSLIMAFSILVSVFFITKSLDYIIHKKSAREMNITLSEKSKCHLGGYLIFDVKFTSWLFAGYVTIHLKSPYWEERFIPFRYDGIKKLGHLKGKYKDESVQLRCNVPAHWGPGEYHVAVRINDVCVWPFSIKKTFTMNEESLKVAVSEDEV